MTELTRQQMGVVMLSLGGLWLLAVIWGNLKSKGGDE